LVVVDSGRLGEGSRPPPVWLERASVDGHTAAWYGGVLPLRTSSQGALLDLGAKEPLLRLGPGYRRLEFQFSAPTFAAPASVQFRYQLEGYDEDWMEAGAERVATYPRLSPGPYVFKVKACNSEGIWGQSVTSLRLVVTPAVWQTWWFRSSAVAGFTLAVVAIVRYVSFRRLHRQLRLLEAQAALHKERARIAKDIHDDLGSNLTQIALLGELARQDRAEPEKAVARIDTMSSTARQAIKSLDEIVWAVNPRNDTLAHLIDYAGQFALDYLRLAGIRCRLDFPEQAPPHDLSTEVRHNLFLVIKEALNNVAKHARASEVWLRVSVSERGLELQIEDNGCGFAQAPDNALADGLRNMRQRLADIGGEFHIESQPGAGTKIIISLPWRKA
jgi:two-component sensor histidine kinase